MNLPDSYWLNRKAPTQVTPGIRRVVDQKPSSRSKGETYKRVSHYDEYGRMIGQTHYTDHGEPSVHPNPHHHRRNPVTGQPVRNPETGSNVWPGVSPDEISQ